MEERFEFKSKACGSSVNVKLKLFLSSYLILVAPCPQFPYHKLNSYGRGVGSILIK